MGFKTDITNQKFNKLTVLEFSHNSKKRASIWLCLCECGNTKTIEYNSIVKGRIKSCGCLQKEAMKKLCTHGMHKTKFYSKWSSMKGRCNRESTVNYEIYGGRGISYCPEWEDFQKFYEDMYEGFSEGLELDRVDVNGNYCKENCRWVTHSENNFNKNKQPNNKSGKTGVSFDSKRLQWRAYIDKDKKRTELGYFDDYKDAVEVRVLEELELYGYTRP